MSEAMDGRREAHMEVLVAVFGKVSCSRGRSWRQAESNLAWTKTAKIAYNKAI
jgi:hypothetical protein